MPKFQVTRELNATRCEICHQTDLFDEVSGRCGRCEGVSIPKVTPPSVRMGRMPLWERILWMNGWKVLALYGLFILLLFFSIWFLAPLIAPGPAVPQK